MTESINLSKISKVLFRSNLKFVILPKYASKKGTKKGSKNKITKKTNWNNEEKKPSKTLLVKFLTQNTIFIKISISS